MDWQDSIFAKTCERQRDSIDTLRGTGFAPQEKYQ